MNKNKIIMPDGKLLENSRHVGIIRCSWLYKKFIIPLGKLLITRGKNFLALQPTILTKISNILLLLFISLQILGYHFHVFLKSNSQESLWNVNNKKKKLQMFTELLPMSKCCICISRWHFSHKPCLGKTTTKQIYFFLPFL